jgi:pentatricopeptide repeat protein
LNARSLNHVFWDSVLEGYARTGETAKALQVYQESKQKGGWQADHSKIAWRALRELLMALTRDGDWDTARAIVAHKVMENGGVVLPPNHDTRADGHVSQFAFWELARSLKLLEKKS